MQMLDTPLITSTLGLLDGDMRSRQMTDPATNNWGSDGALTLATVASLSSGYNLSKMMTEFTKWYTNGAYSLNHEKLMPGHTTRYALEEYLQAHDPYSSGGRGIHDNGSGALMRLTPVVLFLITQYGNEFYKDDAARLILHQVAGLTHNHPQGLIGAGLYGTFLSLLLTTRNVQDAAEEALAETYEYYSKHTIFANELPAFERLNRPAFVEMSIDALEANGYFISTIESVLWVMYHAVSYEDALTLTRGIAGQSHRILPLVGALAGMYFGVSQLPDYIKNIEKNNVAAQVLERALRSGNFIAQPAMNE